MENTGITWGYTGCVYIYMNMHIHRSYGVYIGLCRDNGKDNGHCHRV